MGTRRKHVNKKKKSVHKHKKIEELLLVKMFILLSCYHRDHEKATNKMKCIIIKEGGIDGYKLKCHLSV